MLVGTSQIRLYAPWVQSLKDKRMLVQSLVSKLRRRYNLSVIEAGEQDTLKTAVIGIGCVSNSRAQLEALLEAAERFVETSTDALVVDVAVEIL